MKILFISVSGRLPSDGSRLISALLKQDGHKVLNVCLARTEPDYSEGEFEKLNHLLESTELVLIAVYSNYAYRAEKLTAFIHNRFPGLLVVWGGPHCISVPEYSLKFADAICFSEGEKCILELVERLEKNIPYQNIHNMAFRVNGENIINHALPPYEELDSLPYYDFSFDDQYLLDIELTPLDKSNIIDLFKQYPFYTPTLYFLTSRGCTQKCSFCNNIRYTTLFGPHKIRFYSTERIIREIRETLDKLDFIKFIGIADDDFFARSLEKVEEFANLYKQEINLPFGVAVTPRSYSKDKLQVLVEHGLKAINIGVQSGSQKVLDDIYHRRINLEKTRDIIHEISEYNANAGVITVVDFIIDNPYETKEDIMATFKFILDMPPETKINLFYLSFYPGTPIYDRALLDGLIEPYGDGNFRSFSRSTLRYQVNYETLLVQALRLNRLNPRLRRLPKIFFKLLGTRPIRTMANLLPDNLILIFSDAMRLKKAPWKIKDFH